MGHQSDKKVIVWDLDDVLNHFTEAWLKWGWQAEHPGSHVAYGQLRSNPPLAELNTTQAEYLGSLDRFRVSDIAQTLRPDAVILDWFGRKGGQFRHHVLTARPVQSVAPAAAWVFKHFGTWVRDFHFVPSARPAESLPDYETSKAEVLARIGRVDFFVDDSPKNVSDAAELGIRGFVLPQPWNDSQTTIPEILEQFSRTRRTIPAPITQPT
jgi:FMN phosphatase YigB (HAD superfamily)